MFSIITPSYNNFNHIKKCIGSVRSQTKISRQHIIIDGLSNDDTVEYLNDFIKENNNDSSYSIEFNSSQDKGMYDAINKGWSKANGEILSWLNCDEQYLPNTLSYIKDIFMKNPSIDVVYGNAIIVDKNGDLISARKELPMNKFLISNTFLNIFSCTIFYRRSLWDSGLLYLNNDYNYASDMDLIIRLLKNNVKMYFSKRYLSLFTADGNNLSTHEKAAYENDMIQDQFSFLSKRARKSVKYLRYFLRMINGHYIKKNITYQYATDDMPNYLSKKGLSNGRFKF